MSAEEQAQFEQLLIFLQQTRGFDFTGYKRPSLMRRVLRRMQTHGLKGFEAYADYLQVHPEEFGQLFNTILINVTSFFRDPQSWEHLDKLVVSSILEAKQHGEPVRAWSAGCASGQEAYSIAILLAEALGADAFRDRVKVYATDADEDALAQARLASYSPKEIESLPERLRERYFEPAGSRFLFRSDLRRSVIFGRHDLVSDAPISRLDLLVCRNTLMYFNAETQAKILGRFHFALNGYGAAAGYLFLGRAEMMLAQAHLFAPLELKSRIFIKIPQPGARPSPAFARPAENDAASENFGHERAVPRIEVLDDDDRDRELRRQGAQHPCEGLQSARRSRHGDNFESVHSKDMRKRWNDFRRKRTKS